jgi:hypothetical protein
MIEAALAAQLARLLAPFLPKLMETTATAGKKAVDTLAGKAGEAAYNKAIRVWNMLKQEVEKEPEVAKAIQDVAGKPNDPRAEALLSWQLEKLTLPSGTLAELQKIVTESKSDIRITTADRGGVAIGGDASGNVIIAGSNSTDIESVDFDILKVIADLRVSYPNSDRIKAQLNIDSQELGARLGVLESKGLVEALKGSHMPGVSLPNGIYAAGLTDLGRLKLIKRKQ